MSNSNNSSKRIKRSDRLRDLLAQAQSQRLFRMKEACTISAGNGQSTFDDPGDHRIIESIETMLSGRLPATVCSEMYVTQLATYHQLVSGSIETLLISVESIPIAPARARALGAVIYDILYFFEASLTDSGRLDIYIAMAICDREIVIGLAAEGDVQCLATAEATRAMRRAAEIVQLLGGGFQRGTEDSRQIIGITFPIAFSEALE